MEIKLTFDDGSEGLMHYGVKGMKWGVRHERERIGKPRSRSTADKYGYTAQGNRYRKARLGDKYSQAVVNQRRQYTADQARIKRIAKTVLLGVAGSSAYNTARSRGINRVEAALNAKYGSFIYTQGVKSRQRKLGTTKANVADKFGRRAIYPYQ